MANRSSRGTTGRERRRRNNTADVKDSLPTPSWGIYVHLPWCPVLCHYCGFNKYLADNPPWAPYTAALLRQWESIAPLFPRAADSLFFGGGTPSLHPPALLAELVGALGLAEDAEISMEVLPGTLDKEGLHALLDLGVTRLSVGVQTFQPRWARFLNRGHGPSESQDLLRAITEMDFQSWSLDLIFALPGQTLDDFQADLDEVIAHAPPHVSLYGLTAEQETPYGQAVSQGRIHPPGDELWEAMYETAVERLGQVGLQRYEVSNFAQAGHRCRHNQNTWRGGYYAGLGAEAHGWLPDGRRTVGRPRPADFIQDPLTWEVLEMPEPREAATDFLLTTLRHSEGIPLSELAERGWSLRLQGVEALLDGALLKREGQHLVLQDRGWKLADGILAQLTKALVPTS